MSVAAPLLALLVILLGALGSGPTAGPSGEGSDDPRAIAKLAVNAIESCAASNLDGTYTGCLEIDGLVEQEAALASVADRLEVAPVGTGGWGYEVTARAADDSTFVERHAEDGAITRTCEPADARGCEDGRW